MSPSKDRLLEALVLDRVGNMVSVRLAMNGAILRGIECIGNAQANEKVWVDIGRSKPLAFSSAGYQLISEYIEVLNVENSNTPITGIPRPEEGETSLNADTVDGYHASGTPEPYKLYPLNQDAQLDTSVYGYALLLDGSRPLLGDMDVLASVKIDGVDLSEHDHSGGVGMGKSIMHAYLTGRDDPSAHTQYPLKTGNETITGTWSFGSIVIGGNKITSTSLEITPQSIQVANINLLNSTVRVGSFVSVNASGNVFDSVNAKITDAGRITGLTAKIGDLEVFSNKITASLLETSRINVGNLVIKSGGAEDDILSFGTWNITGAGNAFFNRVIVTESIQNTLFTSGVYGFYISSSGDAEFETIRARGALKTAVFEKEYVSVSSGRIVVSIGELLDSDLLNTDSVIAVRNRVFSVGDYLVIRAPTLNGNVAVEYMKVVSYIGPEIRTNEDGVQYTVYLYAVTRDLGGTGIADWPKGTTVTAIGNAGYSIPQRPLAGEQPGDEYGEYVPGGSISTLSGGYLEIDGTNAIGASPTGGAVGTSGYGPFFGVVRRTGENYNSLSRVVKIGYVGDVPYISSGKWGAFIGDDKNYLYFTEDAGLVIYTRNAAGTDITSFTNGYITTNKIVSRTNNNTKIEFSSTLDLISSGNLNLWSGGNVYLAPAGIVQSAKSVQVERAVHANEANDYFLELKGDGQAGEISLRFHNPNLWWSSIRVRSDGFYFRSGGADWTWRTINAGNINANGTLSASNGISITGNATITGSLSAGAITGSGNLVVTGTGHTLSLANNGGGRLVLANNSNDNNLYLQAWNKDGNGTVGALYITGQYANNLSLLYIRSSYTHFNGGVDIAGTTNIVGDLNVNSSYTIKIGNANLKNTGVTFVVDGGASVPSTGVKLYTVVPYGVKFTNWYITANASGSLNVTIAKTSYSSFPSSFTDQLNMVLSSQQKNSGTTTFTAAAGDVLRINLNSISTIKRFEITLYAERQ